MHTCSRCLKHSNPHNTTQSHTGTHVSFNVETPLYPPPNPTPPLYSQRFSSPTFPDTHTPPLTRTRTNILCIYSVVFSNRIYPSFLHPFLQVFAYDPTMGVEDHQRSEKVRFIATGISNYNGTKLVGMSKSWSMQKVCRKWKFYSS